MKNARLVAALGAALVVGCSTVPVTAQQSPDSTVFGDRGSDMAADLLLVRPLGLVGTVIGAGLFVVALPFTIPSGSVGDAAHEMVARPFEYTFSRPLGDFGGCGADRRRCVEARP